MTKSLQSFSDKQRFAKQMAIDRADKPIVMKRQQQLLESRYQLSHRAHENRTMSRGKPLQLGPATRLPDNVTWENLASMSPLEMRVSGSFPSGFMPLPHPKHDVGGWCLLHGKSNRFQG